MEFNGYIVKVTTLIVGGQVVMIIYMATNKVNGKSYVGQTINSLEQRKREHIRHAMNNKDNSYFHNALRKHDAYSFEWGVLDECSTLERLNMLEVFYIGFYDTFGNGYNLTEGGNNAMCSDETKLILSIANRGKNNPNYGKRGEETSMYGKKHSKETIKRMSASKKGKDNNCTGRTPSKETLKKISGENNHNACGVVINGRCFLTLISAAKFLGVVQTTIINRIKRNVSGYSYATT